MAMLRWFSEKGANTVTSQDPHAQDPQDDKIKTDFLNLPKGMSEMPDRFPTEGTILLTSAWRLKWQIGEQLIVLPVIEHMVIGRSLDANDKSVQFDLTHYGGFHFGVSRHHALLSLVEGYLFLEDTNSTNGTRINGFLMTPRQKYRVRDGDELEFARLRTYVHFDLPRR